MKKNYITILSVLSAVSVIFLHTNVCFWKFSNDITWFSANIIECIFYFAVPIFFMITGANLIDYNKKYSTKEYAIKRITRTVIPFVVWSFIALICKIIMGQINTHNLSVLSLYNGLMNTQFNEIYWFFIPLFSVYLCIPLFSHVEDNKKKFVFSYLVLIGFTLNVLLPFINALFDYKLAIPITVPVVFDYLLYCLIGYLLDKNDLNKSKRIIIYILGILGLITHIYGTYKYSIIKGNIDLTFKGYTNVPCMLYSISIFVFIKYLFKNIKNIKIIDYLGKFTFEFYLIHRIIIWIIDYVYKPNIFSLSYRLGLPFILVPICIFITVILRKLPIVKKIVP